MSKPPKVDKRTYIRCPWCSRQPVQTKGRTLVSHVTPGNLRCIGSGRTAPIAYLIEQGNRIPAK
jgi:hypothetical protein